MVMPTSSSPIADNDSSDIQISWNYYIKRRCCLKLAWTLYVAEIDAFYYYSLQAWLSSWLAHCLCRQRRRMTSWICISLWSAALCSSWHWSGAMQYTKKTASFSSLYVSPLTSRSLAQSQTTCKMQISIV